MRGYTPLFIRKDNEHGICVALRHPNPPYLPIRKGRAPVTPLKGCDIYAESNRGTEKNTIRRKAKKCGMNMSEYLRSLGTGAAVREAPRRELMLAYQKLTTLHDTVRYELAMRDFDEALTEIESLLLRAYHGKEDADGGDEDLGDP